MRLVLILLSLSAFARAGCLETLQTIEEINREMADLRRAIRQDQEALESALRRAHRRNPGNAISRGHLIRQLLERAERELCVEYQMTNRWPAPGFSDFIPLDEKGLAQRQGVTFPRLRLQASPGNTVWFMNGEREKPDAVVVLLSGVGAHSSNASSYFRFMQFVDTMNRMKNDRNAGRTAFSLVRQALRAAPGGDLHRKVALVSFDTPGQGLGPNPEDFTTDEAAFQWLREELLRVRAAFPVGTPLILCARSANSVFSIQLFDDGALPAEGLMLLKPVHIKDWAYSYRDHIRGAHRGMYWENRLAVDFANRMAAANTWHNDPEFFRRLKVPVWMAIGQLDDEVGPEGRRRWRDSLPNGYDEVAGAKYNIFAIEGESRDVGVKSYVAFYRFLDDVVRARTRRAPSRSSSAARP